jgi:AcrR family transcriptional regulator
VQARERILDATTALMERSGFQAVNMAAVAAAAGVSRQTVYAQFGSREELLSQAILRVVAEVFDDLNARTAATQDGADYLVELFVAVRRQFRERAVLGALLFPGDGNPLFDDELLARARPAATHFLAPLVEREPRIADRLDDVVELLSRLGLSILLFDSDAVRSDDDLRAFLRRSLIPVLLPESG